MFRRGSENKRAKPVELTDQCQCCFVNWQLQKQTNSYNSMSPQRKYWQQILYAASEQ